MIDGYSLDPETRLVYLGDRMDIWCFQLLEPGRFLIIGDYRIMLQLSNVQVLTYAAMHRLQTSIEMTLFKWIARKLIRRKYKGVDNRKWTMFSVMAGTGVWYLSDCLKNQNEESGYVNPVKWLYRVLTHPI